MNEYTHELGAALSFTIALIIVGAILNKQKGTEQ